MEGEGKNISRAGDVCCRYYENILDEECIPMSTPMVTNWKKLSDSDSQLVYGTFYR
jgi:hypothetical protein